MARPKATHKAGDCEIIRRDATMCATPAKVVMLRNDGSKMRLCTRHSNQLREQIAAHVTLYDPVTFQVVK